MALRSSPAFLIQWDVPLKEAGLLLLGCSVGRKAPFALPLSLPLLLLRPPALPPLLPPRRCNHRASHVPPAEEGSGFWMRRPASATARSRLIAAAEGAERSTLSAAGQTLCNCTLRSALAFSCKYMTGWRDGLSDGKFTFTTRM